MRPEVEKKIKALLSGHSRQFLSDIYRQTLTNLLSEISFEREVTFDHRLLQRNYWFIQLNLLAKKEPRELAVKQLERILEEWKKLSRRKNSNS